MNKESNHPKLLRRAGQYQDEKINELLNDKVTVYVATILIYIIFLGYEWILWFLPTLRNPLYLTIGIIPVAGVVIWKMFKVRKQIQKHRLGSLGEKVVADELEKVKRQGYMVIHDFQHKAVGNIDHILIGAKGIFALETKNHSKPDDKSRIFYDGENIYKIDSSNNRTIIKNDKGESPIQQASKAAATLQQMLSVDFMVSWVNPVVVFPGWEIKLDTYSKSPNVRVCNEKTLSKQFIGKNDYYQESEVTKIYGFLAENNKNI